MHIREEGLVCLKLMDSEWYFLQSTMRATSSASLSMLLCDRYSTTMLEQPPTGPMSLDECAYCIASINGREARKSMYQRLHADLTWPSIHRSTAYQTTPASSASKPCFRHLSLFLVDHSFLRDLACRKPR
jgi:hypothetical protein